MLIKGFMSPLVICVSDPVFILWLPLNLGGLRAYYPASAPLGLTGYELYMTVGMGGHP